jgi:hypothetical protein
MAARAGDRGDAVLERLAEGLEDGTWKLGKFVEQQHASVQKCLLTVWPPSLSSVNRTGRTPEPAREVAIEAVRALS